MQYERDLGDVQHQPQLSQTARQLLRLLSINTGHSGPSLAINNLYLFREYLNLHAETLLTATWYHLQRGILSTCLPTRQPLRAPPSRVYPTNKTAFPLLFSLISISELVS